MLFHINFVKISSNRQYKIDIPNWALAQITLPLHTPLCLPVRPQVFIYSIRVIYDFFKNLTSCFYMFYCNYHFQQSAYRSHNILLLGQPNNISCKRLKEIFI